MKFNQKKDDTTNSFIRNNHSMLTSIFGTDDVTPFWVADMDFTIANPIKAELQRLVDRGQFAYEFNSQGIFQAISRWYQRRHDLNLDEENFVQVTGVLTGIALLIRELTEEGDSVLIQTPSYHQFPKVITSAGRDVVKSPLSIIDGNYVMDFDDLEVKLSEPTTKVMILCNPHNPTGRVWRHEELDKVLEIADRHNVTIISDEIHSDIIHSGYKFVSLMSLGAKNHVALIGSPSKTFGMQSISNGYIYTENSRILTSMRKLTESLYLDHGNAFTTFATIAAFEKGEEWLDELLQYLQGNIDWIKQFLVANLPLVKMFPVEGTYQIWFDFSATGLTDDSLLKVFSDAGFGASPGTWFGGESKAFARMNFANARQDIIEAFERLKIALETNSQTAVSTTRATNKSCC